MEDWKVQLVLTTVPTVVGAVWTLIQATNWWKDHVTGIKKAAVECVEIGVTAAYNKKVRGWKAANPDGKLAPAQKSEARAIAKEVAKDYAGKNCSKAVLNALKDDFVEKVLEERVQALKETMKGK